MPSYLAVAMAIAVSGSAWQKDVNVGLPDSKARITPFKRGISAMLFPSRYASSAILTHVPAKWIPVRPQEHASLKTACSGEVDTGSPDKNMRRSTRPQSRFDNGEARFVASG